MTDISLLSRFWYFRSANEILKIELLLNFCKVEFILEIRWTFETWSKSFEWFLLRLEWLFNMFKVWYVPVSENQMYNFVMTFLAVVLSSFCESFCIICDNMMLFFLFFPVIRLVSSWSTSFWYFSFIFWRSYHVGYLLVSDSVNFANVFNLLLYFVLKILFILIESAKTTVITSISATILLLLVRLSCVWF